MSEIKKNIETCRGEDVLAEVSALPQDPHFGSLANEALDPLKQQAAAQEGWDGYSEVIEQHKPYTFESAIIQMKSNLLLLLRALWQLPFGSGTLRSLADMWQHYITRLQGNETYGIPSRLSSLTDLPSAPLLVADRKISGANCQDGISFAHLACGDNSDVTELSDTNRGWTMVRSLPTMSGVTKATIGCKTLHAAISGSLPNAEELTFPDLGHIDTGETGAPQVNVFYGSSIKKIDMPEVKSVRIVNASYSGYFYNLTGPCEILMPKCTSVISAFDNNYPRLFHTTPGVRKWVLGKIETATNLMTNGNFINLMHFEIGAGTAVSLNLTYWTATNCLDSTATDLVTDEDCHNNLEQFLSNFRTYIALRLAEQPVGNPNNKTLTLSQAVCDAIKDESHLFVFDEGTMTIYAYLTNIKHWTVTK